jgi:hypothetical protein
MHPDDPTPPGGDRRAGAGEEEDSGEIPWGQRFFDRPFLLLILGMVIMLISYTGWGLWEVFSLTPSPLP